MKSWKTIQTETLSLVFAPTGADGTPDPTDARNADYVGAMPEAANYALRDLAGEVPICRTVVIPKDTPSPVSMRTLAPDFRRFMPETGEMLLLGMRPFGDMLFLPKNYPGGVAVPYYAYPEEVTAETSGDHVLDILPECADLLPVYMASRLLLEEDPSSSAVYRNLYEEKKAALSREWSLPGSFESVTGWV